MKIAIDFRQKLLYNYINNFRKVAPVLKKRKHYKLFRRKAVTVNDNVKMRQKKNYNLVYVCRDGKYKKIKVPHGYEVEETLSHIATPEPVLKQEEVAPLSKKEKKARDKAAAKARRADLKLKASKWKHHHGDRIDGRRLKSLNGMTRFMSYIMPERNDAQNTYADSFDVTEAERYCREKTKAGMTGFGMLHVLLASYVRVVSQRPGINRFVSGQEVYSRYSIDVVMTVKKQMTIDSPDTCIKVYFEPTDTIEDIYNKFNKVVAASTGDNGDTSFDSISGAFKKIPRPILRFFVWLINKLDYHGNLPLFLLDVSPFHGSMIITSMGSLGIKPIYHHIYNFGNLPVFLAYGKKKLVSAINSDGSVSKKKVMDIKVVTDERICDGFYYASAFKLMKKYVENPYLLELPPEKVYDDVD